MVKAKYLIFAGGIFAAAIIAFFLFSESEEDRVKEQFEFIAEQVDKSQGENQIIAAAKANRTKEVMIDPLKIHAPAYSISRDISSNEVSTFFLSTRSQYSEISLKFYDFTIAFPGGDTAQVTLTASMEGRSRGGESIQDHHELACTLLKIQDVWRFQEIEVVEVLRK
ncbi:MAG: hypothetical protein V2J25_04735 [Desulfatiglans sp.]|jgi:hypothetical protein|nr:hypothetical protein [Thermodesulfobacteriota bacterium]MEE4352157.1 hypothetical protein [Desulfatiglans sp.]